MPFKAATLKLDERTAVDVQDPYISRWEFGKILRSKKLRFTDDPRAVREKSSFWRPRITPDAESVARVAKANRERIEAAPRAVQVGFALPRILLDRAAEKRRVIAAGKAALRKNER